MRQYRKQKGMVLMVAMIMLILMTIMSITTFNLGRNSLEVLGNMQNSQAVVNVANATVQEVLSNTRMFQNPNSVFLVPCSTPNTRCMDINGDGTNDIEVELTPAPRCIQSRQILSTELVFTNPQDRGCIVQSTSEHGVAGAGQASLCANSLWEVTAVATDQITGAEVAVTQGAAIRVALNDVATSCP